MLDNSVLVCTQACQRGRRHRGTARTLCAAVSFFSPPCRSSKWRRVGCKQARKDQAQTKRKVLKRRQHSSRAVAGLPCRPCRPCHPWRPSSSSQTSPRPPQPRAAFFLSASAPDRLSYLLRHGGLDRGGRATRKLQPGALCAAREFVRTVGIRLLGVALLGLARVSPRGIFRRRLAGRARSSD